MSLAQGFPNTFTGQVTNQVTKNHDNELKKIYNDLNNIMSNHAHTGTGSDGAIITHATSADTATNATHATSADTATNATNSTNSTNATSVPWTGVTGKPAFSPIPIDYVVAQVLGLTGYTKWFSGKIEQWGEMTTNITTTFPIPFVNNCFGVFPNTKTITTDPITVPTYTLIDFLSKTSTGTKSGTYYAIGN
jgi:hypothetical protein